MSRDQQHTAVWNAAIEAAISICRAKIEVFSDEQYASNQPLGSLSERFACEQCIKSIRELILPPLKGSPK